MRTHASILLSSLLFVSLAFVTERFESPVNQPLSSTTAQGVSTHPEPTDNIAPHRGSGRRDVV